MMSSPQKGMREGYHGIDGLRGFSLLKRVSKMSVAAHEKRTSAAKAVNLETRKRHG
jgi:hypothetical protein